MDLLPDSVEDMEKSGIGFTDLTYLLVISGYVLILTLEKIIFDRHSHIYNKIKKRSNRLQNSTSPDMQRTHPATSTDLDELVQAAINPMKSFSMIIKEIKPQEVPLTEELKGPTQEDHKPTDFTPYLLAIALSVHSVRSI